MRLMLSRMLAILPSHQSGRHSRDCGARGHVPADHGSCPDDCVGPDCHVCRHSQSLSARALLGIRKISPQVFLPPEATPRHTEIAAHSKPAATNHAGPAFSGTPTK